MYEDQQLCLKWNNHRKTLFTVFDNLLEEESLVDVALMADGQIIKAHRVILSACSPYFQAILREHFVEDKLPIFILKDIDIENLRSLIEYMYKGEVHVQQSMFSSFIKAAESLQIRGLAEKQAGDDSQAPSQSNPTPSPPSDAYPQPVANGMKLNGVRIPHPSPADPSSSNLGFGNGTLPQQLTKASFSQDNTLQQQQRSPSTPRSKKSRKSEPKQAPTPLSSSQHSPGGFLPHGLKDFLANMSPIAVKNLAACAFPFPRATGPSRLSNINNNDQDDGQVGRDDDIDSGKENRLETISTHSNDDTNTSNVMTSEEEEEEEMSMPAPQVGLGQAAKIIINPWTGEQMKFNEEQEFGPKHDDTGMAGWPNTLGEFPDVAQSPLSSHSATPSYSAANASSPDFSQRSQRLKRLNSSQQHSVYSMCQTPEGIKYRCLACNRCFNLKCTLLRHVRHQHQGRFVPHPCEQCGQVFKRTDHLKVHMKKIHNIVSLVKPKV